MRLCSYLDFQNQQQVCLQVGRSSIAREYVTTQRKQRIPEKESETENSINVIVPREMRSRMWERETHTHTNEPQPIKKTHNIHNAPTQPTHTSLSLLRQPPLPPPPKKPYEQLEII